MTRDEAITLIKELFRSQNADTEGLNDKNLGGATIGEFQIFFEYQPTVGALKCSAHIYSFKNDPKPGMLEGFQKEEAAKTADTAGGMVEYQPENKGLYLTRVYQRVVPAEQFVDDCGKLMMATRVWGGEVLERVAAKVFGHG